MVDYSKWDKFQANLSDDDTEEEDNGGYNNKARVTRLDDSTGHRVEIGPGGARVVDSSYSSTPSSSSSSAPAKAVLTTLSANEPGSTTEAVTSSAPQNLTGEASLHVPGLSADMIAEFTKNGKMEENYCWSQSRLEVVLRIPIEQNVRAKDIGLRLDSHNNLVITAGVSNMICGKLQYDVLRNDDTFDCPLDWEIKSYGGVKVIEVLLIKKSPIPNAGIWWKNVIVGDSEIDLSSFAGRYKRSLTNAEAWNEAHNQFKAKVANIVPTTIDTDI
jgi:hypothetical protein